MAIQDLPVGLISFPIAGMGLAHRGPMGLTSTPSYMCSRGSREGCSPAAMGIQGYLLVTAQDSQCY